MRFISFFYFFLFFLYQNVLFSNEVEQYFQSGNELFQQKRYAEAIESYQKATATGLVSAALYANMGNAYFQEKKYAEAILHYHRALMLSPSDASLVSDLATCRRAAGLEALSESGLFRAFRKIAAALHPDVWSVIFLLMMWGVSWQFGRFVVWKREHTVVKKSAKRQLMWLIVSSLIVALFAWHSVRIRQHSSLGVVMQNTGVYAVPDTSTEMIDEIRSGETVILRASLGDWWKVSLPYGGLAWLPAAAVEKVDIHQ